MAKPTLILMPKHLITQWLKAIDLIAPNAFETYKYHGDVRRSKPNAAERTVLGNLHQGHELFDGKEQRARTLIISSYTTFAARHGPAANTKYRTNKLAMSKRQCDDERFNPDPRWDANLEGCFKVVINDECHLIKSFAADVSVTVEWLRASRHIMVSASLIPNGIADWYGYMSLVQAFDAEDWWSDASLSEMHFQSDQDPYLLADDHPAAKLQLTKRAVKDFILTHRVNPAEQGARLARIWKKLVIRRTPQSQIPFRNGDKIADSLPRVKAAVISCTFTDQERKWYIEKENTLTGKLLSPAEAHKKPKWSMATQRHLLMLTTWLKLSDLDAVVNLKATNMKATFDQKDFYLEWFKGQNQNPQLSDPAHLLQPLLEGAPKVRALLRNVRSQVCFYSVRLSATGSLQ